MDKQEDQKEVSLPGAGGEEQPSILGVLNRNLISERDNQVTDEKEQPEQQLQVESHRPKEEDHHIDDDISHDKINDTVQLDVRYAAATLVTDLDADDNDSDKNRVLELESHLITEDTSAIVSEDCIQVISELEADTETRAAGNTRRIPSTCKETESVECDIIPLDNSKLSETSSTIINKLGDQRLPVIDHSEKRLSAVEERSNESESSCSEDNNKPSVLPSATGSDPQRPWYQDDDLDPEDQRIIQEAVESILKDVKQQIVKDQEDHSQSPDTTTSLSQNKPIISEVTPLQAPHLILSNPLLQHKVVDESILSVDSPTDLDTENLPNSSPETIHIDTTVTNSKDTSPYIESSHTAPQASIDSPVLFSDTKLVDASSLDSGIASPEIQCSTSVQSKIDNLVDSPETKESPAQPNTVDQSFTSQVKTSENNDQLTISSANVQQNNINVTPETNSPVVTDNIIHKESTDDADATPLPKTDPVTKSLPNETDEATLVNEAKKEYYQRLREYLDNEELNRPPIPLKTYQWEDVRRSKKQGGYPWTHLYKRPLGPDEEPELLILRKSQERQVLAAESPKSIKKVVRIHDEVLVKETERYISELTDDDDTENDDTDEKDDEEEDDRPEDQREDDDHGYHLHEAECQKAEDNFSVQSEPVLSVCSDGKTSKITRIKGILKRRLSLKQSKSGSAPESRAEETTPTIRKRRFNGAQRIARCCQPIMNKLKSLADQKFKRRNIKKVPLKDNEKLDLSEKQKIIKLKSSPRADHGQIAHFVEKQDSDEVLEILELEESPSKARKLRQEERNREESSILVPDEIIELPSTSTADDEPELNFNLQKLDEPSTSTAQRDDMELECSSSPVKPLRRRTEHIYEEIDNMDLEAKIDEILQEAVDSVTRISKQIEEEISKASPEKEIEVATTKEPAEDIELKIVEEDEKEEQLDVGEVELKSALKRESSPGSDKHVTFSHTEDDAEPHREDIDLPEEFTRPNRSSNTSDHEYEPIGQPLEDINQQNMDVDKESSPMPTFHISEPPPENKQTSAPDEASGLTSDEQKELEDDEEHIPSVLEQQLELEERYFSSVPTTPRTDSRTDNEIHTSQVDSSALEELPLKAENRRKGFMASAHDRSRKMSANLRSQAGKIRTKIRGTKKPTAEGSPKAKDRRRFKKPDFSKIKMPDIKRPDLSKFKPPDMPKFKSPEFKRPEFTKFDKPLFTKPDLSKFKIPDTVAIKLRRTRSLKETEVPSTTEATDFTPQSAEATPKKKFEFNFGTYPRMLRKKKQKMSTIIIAKADDLPSTESPQSVESTTLPRQEGGPVSPRWIDKFSEGSFADSESGKYQRYGSEVESLGRESSMERRMKQDLEQSAREQEELEMVHSVELKQFADYDEENRAIHEISRSREGEFKKRRTMVHQDSDLVSEESKDVGWSEKDALRNAILKGSDEQDADNLKPRKYESEEALGSSVTNTNQETQSTASSGTRQKGVIEEIDDDEFILRKRGISQDNIEIRQYISDAIREGLTTPRNTLAQLADKDSYFDISNEQVNYGYDVPPPKPKRAIKNLNNFDQSRDTESREVSQEYQRERRDSFDDNTSLPHDSQGYFANIAPSRPMRRSRKHFHRDDEDHEVPSADIPYLDDEDDNLMFKKINIDAYKQRQDEEDNDVPAVESFKPATPPKAPKRRRKQRESLEKDAYANRFAGRSVSNSFLPSEERDDDFIVYRTQHEYIIPLAQAETFTSSPTPAPRRSRSRSQSHMTDDDRTSRGAESLRSESIRLEEEKFRIDMKDTEGYATVRKEPPPRPPAPRRQRKPSPLPDQHFATMPHLKKESSHEPTQRRLFGTMGPSRPPRRKSSASMGDQQRNQSSPDVTQYEELDVDVDNEQTELENRIESPNRGVLHSGDVINKMKFRPLPPPPRPPRETRRKDRKDPKDEFDDKQDKDDGAEMVACDLHLNGDYDHDKYMEKCIEVEASTQTDPLPDDFCCEEFEITDDMRVIEPRVSRTLQDILREEQHTQPDDNFTKSIQRFREASQRSFSERSKGSTNDRSRTSFGSRPTTPSALILEKRVPTPIGGETMLEAALVVMPIEDDADDRPDANEVLADSMQQTDDYEKKEDEEEEEEKLEDYLQEEEPRLITDHLLVECETMPESAEQPADQLMRDESPPVAPPRKRSSITAEQSPPTEHIYPSADTALLPTTLEVIPQTEQEVERTAPFPSRLTLSDLEVERLNVHELQAGSITVSQLQSSLVRTDELECRSSNVQQQLEIPPGLIDEIVKRVLSSSERHPEPAHAQTAEHQESQANCPTTETPPPPRPPPLESQTQSAHLTSESMQYSIPPPSFYTLRDSAEVDMPPSPTHRRRRHHRRRDSSSDDESYREQRRSRHGTRSPEPSIGQLSGQLLQACGSSVMQSLNQIVGILRANEKEGNDRNISTAIALVIFLTIGFLLLGISGNKNIHHHHWDYFNPPDNKGR